MADPNPNKDPEKFELEPITPAKYPEELNKLAEEIEEMKSGKRDSFSSEFGVDGGESSEKKERPMEEKPKTHAPVEKKKRVYKKRAPRNAPFEEVTPEQEVAPLEEVVPKSEEEAGAPVSVGDVLVKGAYRRKVIEVDIDEKSPGGGTVKTEDLTTPGLQIDTINFQKVKEQFQVEGKEKKGGLDPAVMEKNPDDYFVPDKETAERAAAPAEERAPADEPEEIPMAEFRRAEGRASSQFKIEDAFNNPKFVEFSGSYPDAGKLDPVLNEREIENRYKAFRAQEFLGKELVEFYQKELGEKTGFNLDAATQEKILEEIRDEAIRNPQMLIERGHALADYQRLKENNERWKRQIEDLGGQENRAEVLKKIAQKESLLKSEKGQKKLADFMEGIFHPASAPFIGRFLRKLMSEQELRWHREITGAPKSERENLFRDIDKKIEDLAGLKEELATGKTKERFNALRQEVFQNFEPVRSFIDSLPVKIAEKVAAMTEGLTASAAGLKKAAEIKKYIEKVKDTEKSLGGEELLSERAQLELAQRVNKIVENLVHKHISESKIENQPLKDLHAGIEGMLSKTDDPQERMDLFLAVDEAIGKAIKDLQTKNEALTPKEKSSRNAKTMLLKVVQQKLKNKFGPLTGEYGN